MQRELRKQNRTGSWKRTLSCYVLRLDLFLATAKMQPDRELAVMLGLVARLGFTSGLGATHHRRLHISV